MKQINFDKYQGDQFFEDFDTYEFLYHRYNHERSHEGKKYYCIGRDQAFMLLRALKFKPLTDKKKKQIHNVIGMIEHKGHFPSPPKHKPVTINLETQTIEEGVLRLFCLLFQRKPQLIWLDMRNVPLEVPYE